MIKRFTSRMLGANTYILYSDGEGIVVDPCTKVNIVRDFCDANGIKIVMIVLSHCHIDHSLYLNEYMLEFDARSAIHCHGAEYLTDPEKNGSRLFGLKKEFNEPEIKLNDGDYIKVGTKNMEIMHTPGHSPGSICIFAENILISGDTLFNMSIGRSDLPGGNQLQLEKSLNRIAALPDDTIVYPGHGTFTTLGFEVGHNPFLV